VQIVLTVDKGAVQAQKSKLYSLLSEAKKVTAQSSFASIRYAEKQLYKAEELFEVLTELDLIDGISISREDFELTESKLADIITEKQKQRKRA